MRLCKKWVETQERLFWTLHTAGWFGFAVAYYIGSFLRDMPGWWLLILVLNASAGWLLTIPLRYIYRRALMLSPVKMLILVLSSASIVALAWALVKNINIWEIDKKGYRPHEWSMYFTNTVNSLIMIACWTGAYFGIKNFHMLQKEKQNVLKASTMAHEAQIKMLRYQLNPHFLFNTLNAISTLILMKENKTANAMVSRLSDFLRYSLDKDPIKRVPLQQEIQAMELYLEIEKVRFEERLTLEWDVQDDVDQALVPSLILQPLVENSIKYAISKMGNGGCIGISAQSIGRDLMLEVRDNGPGGDIVEGKLERVSGQGSGVGLSNIQERLHAVYGKNFSFTISHNHPSGIKVSIRIPYQTNESAVED